MNDMINLRDHRGWYVQVHNLKKMLGFKEWPDAGIGATAVGDTVIYVLPARLIAGRKKHRAMAICKHCEKHVPVGRLHQHLKVHKPA